MTSGRSEWQAECQLGPITHAYLNDLVRVVAYGKNKINVIHRLIERAYLPERKVITPQCGGPPERGYT
jgi:hypothetical protein